MSRYLDGPHKAALGAVGAFTAIVTLAAAILAFRTAKLDANNDDLAHQNAVLRQHLEQTRATVAVLRETNGDQRDQITRLLKEVPPTVEEKDVPQVRTKNTVVLGVDGDSIDLNSENPNWDAGAVGSGAEDSVDYSSCSLIGGPALSFHGIDSLRIDKSASYRTCAVASGYVAAGDATPSDLDDDHTCLRLASGRFATIKVIQPSSRQQVKLAVVVWERPEK